MFYEAVPKNVASILSKINKFPLPLNTYLAGGTAVTLYYGHRLSIDIDLFTPESFFTGPIIDTISQTHSTKLEHIAYKDSLISEVDGVRFSLFKYPYPLLNPLIYDNNLSLYLASPIDIAAMKVVAISQRGTAKDFVDLKAIIISNNLTLKELIEQTLKKHKISEDYGYHVKRSLVYFDDAEQGIADVTLLKNGIPSRMSNEEWNIVKDYFRKFIQG